MNRTFLLFLVVMGLNGALAQGARGASFRGLGDLPGGEFKSYAMAASADGSVVAGRSWVSSGGVACYWTADTGPVALGGSSEGYLTTYAYGMSSDGSYIVGAGHPEHSSARRAYRWTQAGGMELLDYLPGGEKNSSAWDASADGSVVVGCSGSKAFRWSQATGLEGLVHGTLFSSEACGVSDDGSIVVGSTAGQAFRWTRQTGAVGLGTLGGAKDSYALDLSADGSVVVGESGHRALRWTQGEGMVDLQSGSGAYASTAYGVSADGSIVVGYAYWVSNERRAAIWDRVHGLRDLRDVLANGHGLDLTGWKLVSADAVSDDGCTIVGFGRNPSGRTEAWIATIAAPLEVDMDIRPGNDFNQVNLGSNAAVPVAILGTDALDVNEVDLASLTLAGADLRQVGNQDARGHYKDINKDGYLDLTVWFTASELLLEPGMTELELVGSLFDGTPIFGTDLITPLGGGGQYMTQTDSGLVVAIPEPGALSLLALGAAVLVRRRPR